MNFSCIYIINGPNLNLLGEREPEIYGSQTLADIETAISQHIKGSKFSMRFLQSNYEGQIIEWIHEARQEAYAIIINPAAYTHTSIAILDALKSFERCVIEVHLSDVNKREEFRKLSYVSLRADEVISGQGWKGYLSATDLVLNL